MIGWPTIPPRAFLPRSQLRVLRPERSLSSTLLQPSSTQQGQWNAAEWLENTRKHGKQLTLRRRRGPGGVVWQALPELYSCLAATGNPGIRPTRIAWPARAQYGSVCRYARSFVRGGTLDRTCRVSTMQPAPRPSRNERTNACPKPASESLASTSCGTKATPKRRKSLKTNNPETRAVCSPTEIVR